MEPNLVSGPCVTFPRKEERRGRRKKRIYLPLNCTIQWFFQYSYRVVNYHRFIPEHLCHLKKKEITLYQLAPYQTRNLFLSLQICPLCTHMRTCVCYLGMPRASALSYILGPGFFFWKQGLTTLLISPAWFSFTILLPFRVLDLQVCTNMPGNSGHVI